MMIIVKNLVFILMLVNVLCQSNPEKRFEGKDYPYKIILDTDAQAQLSITVYNLKKLQKYVKNIKNNHDSNSRIFKCFNKTTQIFENIKQNYRFAISDEESYLILEVSCDILGKEETIFKIKLKNEAMTTLQRVNLSLQLLQENQKKNQIQREMNSKYFASDIYMLKDVISSHADNIKKMQTKLNKQFKKLKSQLQDISKTVENIYKKLGFSMVQI